MKPRLWIVGRWILWLCVGFILLRGLVTMLPARSSTATAPPTPAIAAPDIAADQSAGAFAALFTHEYLTFAPGDDAARTARLQPFLSPSLDGCAGAGLQDLRGFV